MKPQFDPTVFILLCEAISAAYPSDEWSPSVTTSRIERGWYVSVIRWPVAGDKRVVAKAVEADLDAAMNIAARLWLATRNPVSAPTGEQMLRSELEARGVRL